MASHIGTSFHETFWLDRSRLSEVLRFAKLHDSTDVVTRGFSAQDLEDANTSLGNNMRRAFPRYGVGTGLLNTQDNRYRLSELGRAASEYDLTLGGLGTQWLMHYHLSGPEGPGPVFWHKLFAEAIPLGQTFGREEVERTIEGSQTRPLGRKLVRETTTVFLSTYVEPAGLGGLGLIRPALHEMRRYELNLASQSPPFWAFAYALVDHWQRVWPEQVTVAFEALSEPGGLANLLFLDGSRVRDYLSRLQHEEGWIEVFRVAPPFQLVRRWVDPDEKRTEALNRVFADDSG